MQQNEGTYNILRAFTHFDHQIIVLITIDSSLVLTAVSTNEIRTVHRPGHTSVTTVCGELCTVLIHDAGVILGVVGEVAAPVGHGPAGLETLLCCGDGGGGDYQRSGEKFRLDKILHMCIRDIAAILHVFSCIFQDQSRIKSYYFSFSVNPPGTFTVLKTSWFVLAFRRSEDGKITTFRIPVILTFDF